MKFWIAAKGLGTVYSTGNYDEAEAKFKEWMELHEHEVVLWANLNDGLGDVIWKRH